MPETYDAFPLQWPDGRPRATRRKRSAFSTSPASARDGLLDELRRHGARHVVVSTNVATYRRRGRDVMYADQSGAQEDPGVAVYFEWKRESYAFSCDRWDRVHHNVHAIRKTIEALRGIERWGTGEAMRAAFSGFKALPAAGEGSGTPWWQVLGVAPDADAVTIRAAHRARVKQTHPDTPSGSAGAFRAVQEAMSQGLAARST